MLRNQVQSIAEKIGELEAERNEHALVVKTIEPLDPDRRCFRLINGVLIERDIKTILPAVQKNLNGISEVITKLTETLKKRQEELQNFQTRYNLNPQENKDEKKKETKPEDKGEKRSAGVLVE